jgi:tetratricopeptide (TPR) repeat protein
MKTSAVLLGVLCASALGCSSGPNPEMAAEAVEAARAAAERKDHAGVVEICTKALKRNPEIPEAYYLRANANVAMRLDRDAPKTAKEYEDKALSDYSLAIRYNPTYADAHFNRGMVFSSRAQYKPAVEDFMNAARFNPRDPEPHLWLGRLYQDKFEDRAIAALEHYEKYVELGGTDPKVREQVKAWQELKKAAVQPAAKAPTVDDEKKARELHEEFKKLFSEGRKDEAIKVIETILEKHGHTKYAQDQRLQVLLNALKKS